MYLCWGIFLVINLTHYACSGTMSQYLVSLEDDPTDTEILLTIFTIIYSVVETLLVTSYWFDLSISQSRQTNRVLKNTYPNFIYLSTIGPILSIMYVSIMNFTFVIPTQILTSCVLLIITSGAALPLSVAMRHTSIQSFGRIGEGDVESGVTWVD